MTFNENLFIYAVCVRELDCVHLCVVGVMIYAGARFDVCICVCRRSLERELPASLHDSSESLI